MKRIIFLCLVLVSCSTTDRTGGSDRNREGSNQGQETSITVSDEVKMTEEMLPELQKEYPPVNDPQLQQFITSIGNRIVKANNLDGNPYRFTFTVVDVNYVNAFALPAGTIYVTAPLIAMADSEAELAGVVGHEIGHVIARHAAERMDREQKDRNKNLLSAGAGGLLGGVVGLGAGKLLCKSGDRECLLKAGAAGAVIGAGGTLLVQKYKFMANSREDEMEADRIGFKYTVKAGYDKDHVGTFYSKLLQMEKANKGADNPLMKSLSDAMSTHPPSEERVIQMNQMASAATNINSKPILSTAGFGPARAKAQLNAKK